ncbi:hypothetical protein [Azospirillum argentinense]|uniref:hypothetical protein n=1 Tax=Azospirillum argentinense TaxID=2970906 RepID=UPI00190C09D8|nr:hypothetical protein [Azospirillum argentinense]MBK3798459.1 hypothetical protein [Azospirillum argentinense]
MSKDNSEVLAKLDQLTTLFVNEFNGLKTDVSGLKADVSTLKADVSALKTDVSTLKTDVSGLKAGQARLEEEMRKVKEVVGVTRMQEIARLDGRIDQLTLEVMQIRNAAE